MPIYMLLADKGSAIPAILGDVKAPGHQGWIAIESVQPKIAGGRPLTGAGGGAGKVALNVTTLIIFKLMDRSSVKLLGLTTSGQALDGRIDMFGDGSQLPYISYILHDVNVTSMQLSGHSGVGPSESIELSATKIDTVYKAAA